MNFLLIRPKISERKDNIFSLTHLKEPPLGLLYIAAALENNGHKTEIIDCFVENIPEEKLKKYMLVPWRLAEALQLVSSQ